MSARVKKNSRQKSMFWKPIPWGRNLENNTQTAPVSQETAVETKTQSFLQGTHSLVNVSQNCLLRDYEEKTKSGFDLIKTVLTQIMSQVHRSDFVEFANTELMKQLGVSLEKNIWQSVSTSNAQLAVQKLYAKVVFEQFLNLSKDFFVNDPLSGQKTDEAQRILQNAGVHALGIAPCADGRLSHFISYVLRLPYAQARRKAHAGALFDVSESVRNWVFVEHTRFRNGIPNDAAEPTRFMKMAVYHFSKADPSHQGCAAHGSNDEKAAQAALTRLLDFKQAIENRFGCGSTVEIVLVGLNTDDDSFKLHVPDGQGNLSLERFVDTNALYEKTLNMSAEQSRQTIIDEIKACGAFHRSAEPRQGLSELLAWFVENNFSQIEYVNQFENGCYSDIGHAERFISIGNGVEEVQLRNLSYFSYLDTIEEGANDVDVGIKIFKGLNVKRGLPIPIIIRCDYDGRVPNSKARAAEKAKRLEKAIHNRFEELSDCGLISTMATLRDHTGFKPAEKLV